VEKVAKSRWPDDEVTLRLLTRATSTPASTTGSGWADTLATAVVADFVASLAPLSAAAALLARGIQVPLAGKKTVSIPRAGVAAANGAAWVEEGAPAPVVQYTLAANTLGPMHKLALNTVLTRETVEVGGEPVVRQLLRETVAATLDSTLFGSAAATSAKPAGLRAGVTPIAASAESDRFSAVVEDIAALTNAVVAGGGGSNTILVLPPAQASFLNLIGGWGSQGVAVLQAPSLPAGTVMALEASGLATAFGTEPRFESSTEAVVHFDDAAAAPIVSGGAVPAGSVRSAYQQDLVITKVSLDAAWTMRAPGLVAVIENVSW
jgi:hypothetical protein